MPRSSWPAVLTLSLIAVAALAAPPKDNIERSPAPDVLLPTNPVEVPMLRHRDLPVVEAFVNGQGPFRFAIDTATSGQLIASPEFVDRLGLEATGESTMFDGIGGQAITAPRYTIDTLRLGEAEFSSVEAPGLYRSPTVPGEEPLDGVVGIALFRDLALTLDYPQDRIVIARPSLPEPDGEKVLALNPDEAVPEAVITIGGVETRAHIDSRNVGEVHVPQHLTSRLGWVEEPTKRGEARTQAGSYPISVGILEGELRIGASTFNSPRVAVSEIFGNANVGHGVLHRCVLTIEFGRNRMCIERPAD